MSRFQIWWSSPHQLLLSLLPASTFAPSLSLSVRFSVLRSWWSAGLGPGAWTLPCGPLTPPSSSLWAATEPCTSFSGWVIHGWPGVWCARWAFHASRGCFSGTVCLYTFHIRYVVFQAFGLYEMLCVGLHDFSCERVLMWFSVSLYKEDFPFRRPTAQSPPFISLSLTRFKKSWDGSSSACRRSSGSLKCS